MTTIAYRDGILAADMQAEAAGWIVPGGTKKLFRLKDGDVVGVTGDWACLQPWVAWHTGDRREPFYDLGENSRVIRAHSKGLVIYEGKGWFHFDGPFGAWGSGWPAAVAAMHMGADAKRAIEVAMLCDPSTGGDVQVMPVREVAVRAA